MNTFKKLNCPVCNGNSFEVYMKNINHTCNIQKILNIPNSDVETSNINKCLNCNHYYLSSVINDSLMKEYYNVINSEYYTLDSTVKNELEAENIKNVDYIKRFIKKGKVLEIGCGYGFMLDKLRNNNFEVYGVEPSPHASSYAKNTLRLNIEHGFLDISKYELNSFDLIILFDVFEHIYNVNDLMKQIKILLKPKGHFVIGTGNIESIYARFAKKDWWYLSSWEHISFFNKRSVAFLLNNHGFREIDYKTISHRGSFIFNLGIVLKSIFKKIVNKIFCKNYQLNVAFDHLIIHAIKD